MNSLYRSWTRSNVARAARRPSPLLWDAVRACVEPLERRALLSATITAGNISAETPGHTVQVLYTDPNGIDPSTIDSSDLSVGGPQPVGATLDGVVEADGGYRATYTLAGPGGSWDSADNGTYSITVANDAVLDGVGSPMDFGGSTGFDVNIAAPPPPDTTGPSASISVGNVSSAGGGTHSVSVTYADDAGINDGSIGAADITVSRGGSTLNVIGVDVSGGGNSRTAVYTFAAPGGSWDQGDNGGYTVTLNAGAVQDGNGNGNAAGSASFDVNVPPPPDNTAPTASISAGNVGSATATHAITIQYSDDVAFNATSVGADDITVSGPGGNLSVTDVQVSPGGGGKTATAVYMVAGPGGSFDAADNGTYTVSLNAGAVGDNAGNAASASPVNFTVNVPVPDNTGPTASIAAIGNVSAAGVSLVNVVVTYVDDVAMNPGSIGPADLDVSRAGGGGNLDVSNVATVVSPDGKTVVATYTLAAPGGGFDAGDNGTYTVAVRPSQIRDAANNASAGASANFTVNIDAGPGPDTTAPTATISAGNVTTPGGTTHTVTVVYTDDTAMNPASVGPGDITVAGPGGAPLTVTAASGTVSDGGRTVTATYTVAAPGGSFDSADNGTYTVTLNPNGARDAAGNPAAGPPASFGVAVSPPDQAGPLAVVSAGNVTAPGGATHTVTVVYTDDGRIRANTVGVPDITVTNGATVLQVLGVTSAVSDSGNEITAVYTVAAPGGSWDAADNGTYTISVAEGAVVDTQGNPSAAAGGSFTVGASVPDAAGPAVAAIAAGSVTTEGVTTQTVSVTYADDVGLDLNSFGNDDVTVAGPGGPLALNVASVSSAPDGRSAVVTYTFAAPNGAFQFADNGAYSIAVNAGAVTDTSGKGVAAASGTFQVAVPEPTPIDVGFGGGQPVVSDFTVEAVATGVGGKVLVAGRSASGAIVEVRNPDGSPDTNFNRTGQVASNTDTAYFAVVAQGDKVVVAGTLNGDFVLARYHADGRLDSTFGNGGRIVVDFGGTDAAFALAVAPDGKLVAAGQSNGDFAFARFMPDGALDPSFAQGGKQMFDHEGKLDAAGAVVVQSDGKVVVAGTSGTEVVVVRLRADGEADADFSGDGLLVVSGLLARSDGGAAVDRSAALALQPDGRILVGNHTAGDDFGVVRITGSGNVDSSFGDDGLATADFGGADDSDAIIVQPTGEILVVGTSLSGSVGMTTLAAFSSSGQLIEAFGEGGKLMLETGISNPARELHLGDLVLRAFGTRQADGRIVVGTSNGSSAPSQPANNPQSSLRRLNVPGTRNVSAGSQLGTFGIGSNGKPTKLTHTDADGTVITFSIKGGTGTLFQGADGRLNLVLTDGGAGGCTVTVKGRGGDGRIAFGDISANGTIRSMSVKNGDLTGTLCAGGSIGKLTLGNVSGASICSAGNIGTIAANSLTNTKLLAGSNLGADGAFGGTDANADTYNAAAIGAIKVKGEINGSTVGAGLDPVDATFADDDDRVVGGAASFIKSIAARGADDTSRFLSGSFGKVKLGTKVSPDTDPRFRVLA